VVVFAPFESLSDWCENLARRDVTTGGGN